MSVKITIDMNKVLKRIHEGKRQATVAVTEQVIQDGNIFCPEDQGDLKRSAESASIPEQGKAIWDKEYAKKLYDGGMNISKDKNAQATHAWVEKAKEVYGKQWKKVAQKAFEKGMK